MKKICTLLAFALTVFTIKAVAQPTCTAGFDFQFVNANTVKFLPAVTTDSPLVVHSWDFGEGASVFTISPTHAYTAPGTYTVRHFLYRHTANGTFVCADSVFKTLTVQSVACNLQAYFTWAPAAQNPLEIHFTNATVNLEPSDSVTWHFGDGSSSNAVNPTHVYTLAGVYTVCLMVKHNSNSGSTPCISEFCKAVVTTAPCNIQANFTSTVTSNPLEIHFTNTTLNLVGTDSVRWTFGDGSSSGVVNPTHTYGQAGTYNVCLRIQRFNTNSTTPCVSEICKTVTITAPVCNLQASFTAATATTNPLEIHFINTTVSLAATDSILWTFGDGASSSAVNPTHVYAQSGTYYVCLIIRRFNTGSTTPCVSESCKTITIQPVCNVQANFSWQRDSISHKKIYFTNLSTVPNANAVATWSFGDGTTASSWNAVHEYAQPGRYIVCLKIQYNNTCISTICDSVTVEAPAPPCTQLSNYHFARSTANSQTYTFTPDYLNNDIQYTWTFGDGTGSHDPVATHHFAPAGNYTVCLTAFRNNNCASTTCKTVSVTQQLNCDSFHVSYSYQFDPFLPNKVYFYAIANTTIIDQTWTISRPNANPVILHQNNPSYTFSDTGYYQVCVRAVMANGCVKEYCNYIYINHVSNACVLDAYPNPAHNEVKVNVLLLQPEMIHVYVYNSLNVLVLQKNQQGVYGSNPVSLAISNLVSGIYNVRVVHGNSTCFARFYKL